MWWTTQCKRSVCVKNHQPEPGTKGQLREGAKRKYIELVQCRDLKLTFSWGLNQKREYEERTFQGGLYPPPRNPYGLHWTPLDSSGFQCPFCQAKLAGTKPSPLESSPVQSSPVHWTDTGLQATFQSPVPVQWTESPVKVQWSPLESTGFHWNIAYSTYCY